MEARKAVPFSFARRLLLCAVLTLSFLVPMGSASAAEKGPDWAVKLKSIQTYELLDMLAEEQRPSVLRCSWAPGDPDLCFCCSPFD